MLANIAFSHQKGKNHLIINIGSGAGENLLRVPILLSGIAAFLFIFVWFSWLFPPFNTWYWPSRKWRNTSYFRVTLRELWFHGCREQKHKTPATLFIWNAKWWTNSGMIPHKSFYKYFYQFLLSLILNQGELTIPLIQSRVLYLWAKS